MMGRFGSLVILLLVCSSWAKRTRAQDIVQTTKGKVQGTALTSWKGATYYGFLGVPYGKNVGRFEPAQAANPWSDVKQVKTAPPSCYQYNALAGQIQGEEDCFKLNVYSPNPKAGANLPVVVYISPGSFVFGGASFFQAKYAMDHKFVLVTINYRMGALGFLNTGDGTVGGNMGLKDQVLALQWVKSEIANFGGNPNLITIMGTSAGAASVDFLTLSPLAKGLFHRAIAMSGSALCPWAFQRFPANVAQRFAEKANCSQAGWNWARKVQCLKGIDVSAVVAAQRALYQELGGKVVLLPSIDSSKTGQFLTATPKSLLEKGNIASKVPFFTGSVNNEGGFDAGPILSNPTTLSSVDTNWNSVAPLLFYYDDTVDKANLNTVSQSIRSHYFGNNAKVSSQTRQQFENVFNDRIYWNCGAESIRLHGKYQPTYPYNFVYSGSQSFVQLFYGLQKQGVGHCDDLIYLFNGAFGSSEIAKGSNDEKMMTQLWDLLVSFANQGTPTATWGSQKTWPAHGGAPPISYYRMDLAQTSLISDPHKSNRDWWAKLPLKEN